MRLNRSPLVVAAFHLGLSVWTGSQLLGLGAVQPNIIVFMVDDLGWNHISARKGALGTGDQAFVTPHLERFARSGLSFTHAYAQPNCAPTRAAMLTGQVSARIHNDVYVVQHLNRFGRGGLTRDQARFAGPAQSQDVAVEAVTVAEALRRNGYATAHIGKYHVGGHAGPETMPENAGFDINLGGFSQGHQPTCFASKSNGAWEFKGVGMGHFDRYADPYHPAYLDRRGFPAALAGTPKHISDALGDALEDTLRDLAPSEKPFYLQFHTYAVHGPVRARPDLKREAMTRMGDGAASKAEYAGFIAGMDVTLGRLMAALEDPDGNGDSSDGIAARTLILFTSDNGGVHAGNEPLRGRKGMFTEGGLRVPLIARWPGVIPADTMSRLKVHSVDYYPTFLELAGWRWAPPVSTHPLDGFSFADVLRDPGLRRTRDPVFYLFPGYLDVRAQPCVVAIDDLEGGRYKLSYFYESTSWALYNLSDDPGEADNLVETRPSIAARIAGKIDRWLTQTHPTWKPKYPIHKDTGRPAGPPPAFSNRPPNHD